MNDTYYGILNLFISKIDYINQNTEYDEIRNVHRNKKNINGVNILYYKNEMHTINKGSYVVNVDDQLHDIVVVKDTPVHTRIIAKGDAKTMIDRRESSFTWMPAVIELNIHNVQGTYTLKVHIFDTKTNRDDKFDKIIVSLKTRDMILFRKISINDDWYKKKNISKLPYTVIPGRGSAGSAAPAAGGKR